MKKTLFVLFGMLIAAAAFADTKWAVWFTDTADPLDSSLKLSLVVADEVTFEEDGFVRLGGTIKYLRRANNVDLGKILKNVQKFEDRAKFVSKDDFYLTKTRIYVIKQYDSTTISAERRKAEAEAAEEALKNAETTEGAEATENAEGAVAAAEKTENATTPEKAAPAENAASENSIAIENPESIENAEPSENAEAVEAEPVEEVKPKKAKKVKPVKVKKPKKVKAAPEPEPEPEVVEAPAEAEEAAENPETESPEAKAE